MFFVIVSAQPKLLFTIKVTFLTPAVAYKCDGDCVVFSVLLSPKFQFQFVIVPDAVVDASIKLVVIPLQ